MSIYLACFILGVRLSGGYGNAGRVEVYYNGQWGTICDDYWDINDARVVCKQLGFEDALKSLGDSYYDMGTGNIWMDQVNCKGSESSLFLCEHRGWGNHDCSHTQDAGVSCKSNEGDLYEYIFCKVLVVVTMRALHVKQNEFLENFKKVLKNIFIFSLSKKEVSYSGKYVLDKSYKSFRYNM